MNHGIFTALAVAVIILAAMFAIFNLTLSLIMIASVLIAGVGILIHRVKFQG